MDITKLRLNKSKNGNGLELSYEKPGANGDRVAVSGEIHTAIIHNDLYNAIQSLAPHLAIMAFHVREIDVPDIAMPPAELLKDFTVGSYSISGKDEKRGIIISGTLRKGGKAHNFNTPLYRFEEPETTKYTYMDDVAARVAVIEAEATEYLAGSKRGESGELPFDENKADKKVTKMTVVPGEKVTEEGNLAGDKTKHQYADKDAMERVKDMPTGSSKGNGRKRVAQSAAAPGGIAEEAT